MPKIYCLLLGLSCLLLSCSQPQNTREVATAPGPPATSDTASSLPEPDTTRQVAGLEIAPAESSAGSPTSLPRTHQPPLVPPRLPDSNAARRQGPSRNATTLADASTTDNDVSLDAATNDRAALRRFLVSGLPKAQEFTVRPGRDTVLRGSQGTEIQVPANAWNVPGNTGSVRLQLREFYSAADIILAGLGTTTNGKLLETGGMLHLAATTTTGRPVTLRTNASLHLRLPTTQVKPDMLLFRGEQAGKQVNWQLDDAVATGPFSVNLLAFDTAIARRSGSYWPKYLAGEQQRQELKKISYPASVIASVLRSRQFAQERATVYGYNVYSHSKPEAVQRLAEVEFTVDTTGTVINARVRPGYSAELAAPVLALIKKWKRWAPAVRTTAYGLEKIVAVGVVRVLITATGKTVVNPITWDYDATETSLKAVAAVREKAGVVSTQDLYQELNTAGLGWINCDRFINSQQPLVAFELNSPGPAAEMMLCFKNIRSVINGVPTTGQKVSFGQVPDGTKATLVAMHWKQGQAYLALQPTTVSARPKDEPLNFLPVTIGQMRQALAALK